jgi:hypothetical protein
MRSRRSLVHLMAAAALLGMGAVGSSARAQDAPPQTGESLFGTYQLEARGIGIEGSYEIEGLLPGGSPVLDLTIPESLARFSSGPSGYGLASLAYPGGILVNLASLIEQTGSDGSQIPPYPIKAEAFFPSGPTEVDASQPGGVAQRVVTGELGVEAAGSFPKVEAPPAVNIGSITSVSRTAIEDGKAVSRARVELGDIAILGGVVTIDSVVTDIVAVHDGQAGTTDGGTRVSGVQFLGLDAAFTEDGLVLTEAPPVEGPGEPLGDLLDPLVGPLRDALAPVQDALADILAQAVPQVDDLLATAGITMRVVQPEDVVVESGAVARISSGLSIEFSYEGREQTQLADLINSLPDELKPNIGPIPFPLAFFAENHIAGFNLAPASVSTLATPPFDVDALPPIPDVPIDPGSVDPGTPGFSAPGFETPLPDIPAGPTPSPPLGPLEEAASPFDGAIPALLVLGVLLLSPLFGVGSTKLADNVLAPVSTGCPTGHDKPPPARLL